MSEVMKGPEHLIARWWLSAFGVLLAVSSLAVSAERVVLGEEFSTTG